MSSSNMVGINSPRFQRRVVAFVDILGFKDICRNGGQDILLELLKKIRNFNSDFKQEETINQENGSSNLKTYVDFSAYSDHIILSAPIEMESISYNELFTHEETRITVVMDAIIEHISRLYVAALLEGIALRGGIALGDVYYDKPGNLIMGIPLIEAIEAEDKIANYPRIILTESMRSQPKHGNFYKEDSDGLFYVNWLNRIIFQAQTVQPDISSKNLMENNFALLNKLRNQIKRNILLHENNLRISSKWAWLANYFDYSLCFWNNLDSYPKIEAIKREMYV